MIPSSFQEQPRTSKEETSRDCNVLRCDFIAGLPNIVNNSYEKVFHENYADCIHITVIKGIEEQNVGLQNLVKDGTFEHSYACPLNELDFFEVCQNTWCVCMKERMGVVCQETRNKKMTCVTCQKENCEHTNAMKKHLETDITHMESDQTHGLESDQTFLVDQKVLNSLSSQKITFCKVPPTIIQLYTVSPDQSGNCKNGHSWTEAVPFETSVVCYSENLTTDVTVITLHCKECHEKKIYDGQIDGILHMKGYLITHNILRSYMRQFVTEGTTMYSFFKMIQWQKMECSDKKFYETMTYKKFKESWYAYLHLLDIPIEGFSCAMCGSEVDTVIMDGVGVTFSKSFIPSDTKPVNLLLPQLVGSSHKERIFIQCAKTRTLLVKFCDGELQFDELNTLKSMVQTNAPSLTAILEKCILEKWTKCPSIICDFLRALSGTSPVCSFISPKVFTVVNKLCEQKTELDTEELKQLQYYCPLLYKIYQIGLPEELSDVLKAALEKANAPFCGRNSHNLQSSTKESPLGIFPNIHTRCERGSYVADKSKHLGECKKSAYARRGNHTNGLFTISCPHGVCYGVQVMVDMESPNVPFTLLRTRFAKAPSVIIYDNCCKLHQYCLNRDPVFFKNTLFVIDRLHWKNHKGCSIGYSMNEYTILNNINSQIAEQRNSTLVKLKSMVSYMTLDNFKANVYFFIWFRNMIAKSKTNTQLPEFAQFFGELTKFYTTNH